MLNEIGYGLINQNNKKELVDDLGEFRCFFSFVMTQESVLSSSEKVYNPWVSLIINIVCVILIPMIWWLWFDFEMPDLSQAVARKLSQIGVLLNFMAGLFLIIRFLWQGRYNNRLDQVIALDEKLDEYFDLKSRDIVTEDSADQLDTEVKCKRENLYKEMVNIYELDKVEKTHVYLGAVTLAVGSLFQMIGAGVVS